MTPFWRPIFRVGGNNRMGDSAILAEWRFLPPLIVTQEQLDEITRLFSEAVHAACAALNV